ncbi:TonB-dependent receptor plug domain-containing protein [Sphingobium aquiterrae]|uniref:TonB-dependent receptor plug domain-containing protein n=1 Tax=Sphingobium aquiterrae TaxID=2038656 RepID=UPI0030195A5C
MHTVSHFFCLSALIASPALAQTPDTEASAGADADNSQIVVTALRTPVERDRVSSSVTVLDREDIEQAQPIAISDALVRTPGISMVRNGGYGTTTSLRIRGADAGQTVFVIDGMRLADPSSTAGGYSFSNLLTDDIERIEILRGPQSILWGSDAIGGVVNVQTARPTKALEGSAAMEAGSRQTISGRAAVGGHSDLLDWRLSGSTFTTDGISALASGTEKDGYRRNAGNGTATLRLSQAVSVDLRGYYASARNDFDGSSGDAPVYGLTKEWTVYAGINAALLDGRLRNRIAILQSDTDRENYDPRRTIRALNFDAKGKVRRYEYQGTFTLSPLADMVFGAEREEQRMTNGSPANNALPYTLTQTRADIDSLYAELRLTPLAGLTLNGGARRDHHSNFGGNTVFSAGAAWSLNKGATVLRASYDEGFKAPSLYQLFSLYGAANLQPEKAQSWEAGIEQALLGEKLRLSGTWFERQTDNLIDFAYCPTSGALPAICYVPGTTTTRFGYYANVNKSRAHGLEFAGTLHLGRLTMDGNYSWIAAVDRTEGGNFNRQLARVPRHLANGRIGYDFPFGVTTSVALRYAGGSLDRIGGTMLDDYLLTDLRAEWKLLPGLTVQGRIENLFDVAYETAGGYSSLGRSVYLGIRSRF